MAKRATRAKAAAPARAAADPQHGASAAPAPAGGAARIRVRMYRQGLGDCFLISILRPAGAPFHMMIDCGVILGTPDAGDRLAAVVGDIVAETGGRVDVLVVTHEHYDHVAGFVLAKDLFVPAGEPPAPGRLAVSSVWFAWTEDPADANASQLRAERKSRLEALAAMANRLALSGAAADAAPDLASALQFFGVDRAGGGVGQTAQGMANAAALAPRASVAYRRPGDLVILPEAPELRFYVLGPPTERRSLMKTDSSTEVYAFGADGLMESVAFAIGGEPTPEDPDPAQPFDPAWGGRLDAIAAGSARGPLEDFVRKHYLGPPDPSPEADVTWRRIDGAWTASADQLALALDGATNNTSLALAIEIAGSGDVLLFPADAQVGNWLSWQQLAWDGGGRPVRISDLLGRTVFYKVGHHGSHNATLKTLGLELMPKQGLAAFIPVDHDMAVKKRWGKMPLPALVDALKARCGDAVARIDQDLPVGVAAMTAGRPGGPFGTLFHDWTLAL